MQSACTNNINDKKLLDEKSDNDRLSKTKLENKVNEAKRKDQFAEMKHQIAIAKGRIWLKILEIIHTKVTPYGLVFLSVFGIVYVIYMLIIYFCNTKPDVKIQDFYTVIKASIMFIAGIVTNELRVYKIRDKQ